jgi:TonB family protein
MRFFLTSAAVLLFSVACFSQDLKLREQAITMLEKANAASEPANLPNLERDDTFQLYGEQDVQQGAFTRTVIQGTGRRDDWEFGDYRVVRIWTDRRLAVVGSSGIAPAAVEDFMRLTPILRVHFDHEDVIRTIVEREINGRPAHCIEFDTIAGESRSSNEICTDDANGTLIHAQLFDEVIENSEFFAFAGALMPGRITDSKSGVLKMEITQSMKPLMEVTANVLAAPPNAEIRRMCTTYRQAFGISMPQPRPGNGNEVSDVLVRGMIGVDGRVREAVVQDSDRPDLNTEALSVIQQWVFSPALCEGKPNQEEATFTLHFQGR